MKWKFRSLIFDTVRDGPKWANKGALTPTPIVLHDRVRVFSGFRDSLGISRIGYVDIDPVHNRILDVSETPSLDIGKDGCFDDNGVILGDILRTEDGWYLYYIGFQKPEKAKFLAFTGIAHSSDLKSFTRLKFTPFLDRSPIGHYIMAVHSVIRDADDFLFYISAGSGWSMINGKDYPEYRIYCIKSSSFLEIHGTPKLCVPNSDFEYRCGRPRVYKTDKDYLMSFTRGDLNGGYFPASSSSANGLDWTRDDQMIQPLIDQENTLQNRHLCYPSYFEFLGRKYCVYNGNNMGEKGILLGILET